ncbi:hypothetical protein KC343_g22086, partial [Hortaea werneckii]
TSGSGQIAGSRAHLARYPGQQADRVCCWAAIANGSARRDQDDPPYPSIIAKDELRADDDLDEAGAIARASSGM